MQNDTQPPISSEAIPNPQKFYLIGCSLVTALGGLLFGFDTAVVAGTTGWLKSNFALSDAALGFTVASALIGTMVGSLAVGKPADIFGRKIILIVLALFYLVSALGCAFAGGWWEFVTFRFIGGIAVGGASVMAPMYIAEISPARLRGRLVAITQFNVVFGILLAYLSNWGINHFFGELLGDSQYRWMFGVEAFPALAFFLLLMLTPQSPRWLVAKQREEEARGILLRCGTDGGSVEEEISEIRDSLDLTHHSLKEPFFRKKYSKPILLAMAIAAFNQLSGINAVLYYTPDIFRMAGASVESALLQSVIIGFVMLTTTTLAMVVIDHFGRRNLMLVGTFGYLVGLGGTAWAFYTGGNGTLLLVSLLLFVAAHGFGQGAVIWVFLSEIFPNRLRARGQALGSFTLWTTNAAISFSFPMIAAAAGWKAFAFYFCCMCVQLVWIIRVMPETKGISLEKIQRELGIE
jgi:SP family xylose:H+ symportor-like MFS transporter